MRAARTTRRTALAGAVLLAACSGGGSTSDWFEENKARYEALCTEELPVGTPRARVIEVLGAPTQEDAKGLHCDSGEYWLSVLLDEQGRVRATELCRY